MISISYHRFSISPSFCFRGSSNLDNNIDIPISSALELVSRLFSILQRQTPYDQLFANQILHASLIYSTLSTQTANCVLGARGTSHTHQWKIRTAIHHVLSSTSRSPSEIHILSTSLSPRTTASSSLCFHLQAGLPTTECGTRWLWRIHRLRA